MSGASPEVDLDAWQLRYPRTGLGNVTAELIRCWVQQGRGRRLRVWAPSGVDAASWRIDPATVQWRTLPDPAARTDYVARWQWSRGFVRALARERAGQRVVVPYLYNHWGHLRRSVVLVPDLVYRAIPFADFAAHPWWDVRRRFYLRRMVMKAEEMMVRRARGWVVYSEFVARDAEERLGLERARIAVTSLGPGPMFTAEGPGPAALGVPGFESPYVLYVGGYGFRKNVPMLATACVAAAAQEPGFRCVFAGISTTELLEHLRRAGVDVGGTPPAGIQGIDDVDDARLAALYRQARFTVFPSRAEGFGLPVVEAAACGRCTLTADNTSLRELQTDSALRLADNDPAAWTTAMLRLWRDDAARRRAEAALPALLRGRTNERFAEDMWSAVERALA